MAQARAGLRTSPVDEPGFATNAERVRNRDAVNAAVDSAFATYALADLLPRLAELGVPAGEVRSLDRVYDWEQTRSQGLLVEVEHATPGGITLPGPPLRFDDERGRQPRRTRRTDDAAGELTRRRRDRWLAGGTRRAMTAPASSRSLRDVARRGQLGAVGRAGRRPEPADPAYAAALRRARERTGLDEAVVTGEGRIRGRRVAVVACEFGFLAGSIGVAAAERLVAAVERATDERLPLLASPTSGGTRMQEGTVAFLQMVKISAAIGRHKAAGNPYLVYLRNPTTGGVLASWGSLGHVTVAEPGALIGFLGPRVYEALYGGEFPAGRADRGEPVRARHRRRRRRRPRRSPTSPTGRSTCWPRAAGEAPRPDGRARGGTDADDPGPAGLGVDHAVPPARPARGAPAAAARGPRRRPAARHRRRARPTRACCWRWPGSAGRPASCSGRTGAARAPARRSARPALREARRGMRLADELKLPLLTVIDTAGAALSKEAEEGGLAGEIARSLADLVLLDAPDRLPAARRGRGRRRARPAARRPGGRARSTPGSSPLPPEGASAIIHRTTDRAPRDGRRPGRALAGPAAGRHRRPGRAERPDAADEPAAVPGPAGPGARGRADRAAPPRSPHPARGPAGALPPPRRLHRARPPRVAA